MFIAIALSQAALAGVPEGDLKMTRVALDGSALSYNLDAKSWEGLVVRDAPATLAVFQGSTLLWSAPIQRESGTIHLPEAPRGSAPISVQVIAFRGAWMARSLNGQERLIVDSGRKQGGGKGHGGSHRDHSHGQSHRQATFSISEVIEACDDAFYDSGRELQCVNAAKVAIVDPTPMIAACDDAFYSESQVLACVQTAAIAREDIAPLIDACDDAMYEERSTQRCIAAAAATTERRDHPSMARMEQTIEACDDAFYADASIASCVEGALGHGRGAEVVAACDDAYYSERDTLACMTASLPAARREEEAVADSRGHQRPR
ncbi:MAG: hypothetical protein VX899_08570 [Myxococcota bacterium]|nr:hypothetical protein [Myxococcota bacterium]